MRHLFLAALAACSCTDASTDGPTWTVDVQPVVAEHCGACHVDGGAAPFVFTTHADAAPHSGLMVAAIDAGRMPPWSPDPACGTFVGAPTFTNADADLIRAWHDAGAPEGPARDPVAAPVSAGLERVDVTGGVPGFVPAEGTADQYRCFVLDDVAFEAEAWLRASQVVPASPQVHHVLVYALGASQREQVAVLEAADEAPGYTCFGAPLPTDDGGLEEGFPAQVGAWVPGADPIDLGDDMAIRVAAGSFVVLQVHYNTAVGERVPDTTTWSAMLRDTPPAELFVTAPIPIQELDIPAGAPDVRVERTVPYHGERPLRIRQLAGHMHLLGTSIGASATSPDGAETCLVDIPAWDFDQQRAYPLADEVQVPSGGSVTVACSYDNTAANQPIVDGVQAAPVDVGWGEGTHDEMCLLYVGRVEPYAPEPLPEALPCGEASECLDTCGDDPIPCALACPPTRADCGMCLFDAASTCAPTCLFGLLGQEDCVEGCFVSALMLGGHLGACLEAECPDAWAALSACGGPACTDAFAACGA